MAWPPAPTDTRVVTPEPRSRRNTSRTPLLSPATSEAEPDTNAASRPSPDSDSEPCAADSLAETPAGVTVTSCGATAAEARPAVTASATAIRPSAMRDVFIVTRSSWEALMCPSGRQRKRLRPFRHRVAGAGRRGKHPCGGGRSPGRGSFPQVCSLHMRRAAVCGGQPWPRRPRRRMVARVPLATEVRPDVRHRRVPGKARRRRRGGAADRDAAGDARTRADSTGVSLYGGEHEGELLASIWAGDDGGVTAREPVLRALERHGQVARRALHRGLLPDRADTG